MPRSMRGGEKRKPPHLVGYRKRMVVGSSSASATKLSCQNRCRAVNPRNHNGFGDFSRLKLGVHFLDATPRKLEFWGLELNWKDFSQYPLIIIEKYRKLW